MGQLYTVPHSSYFFSTSNLNISHKSLIVNYHIIKNHHLPEHNVGRGNNCQIDSHHEIAGGQVPQVQRVLGVRLATPGADHIASEQDQQITDDSNRSHNPYAEMKEEKSNLKLGWLDAQNVVSKKRVFNEIMFIVEAGDVHKIKNAKRGHVPLFFRLSNCFGSILGSSRWYVVPIK